MKILNKDNESIYLYTFDSMNLIKDKFLKQDTSIRIPFKTKDLNLLYG